MRLEKLAEYCCEIKAGYVAGESMACHTSFKIGGPADIFITASSKPQLSALLKKCKELDVPYMIIGKGSNLLVSDQGIEGAVISLAGIDFIRADGERIMCGAGAALSEVCRLALDNSLSGLEFAYGIPGSLGGALYMNAGAYGGQMSDVVISAECVNSEGKGTFGSLQVNGNANIGGDATVDGKLYAKEGGVFSNSASDFSAGNNTVINGDGMEISENGTIAAYYGKYGMQVGGLTYDGMRNTLNVGGGTITGLADGGVYRGSSDAVTGNQLWQAYQRMDDLQESINIVGAHAAALSGLAPVPYNPYQPTTLSAAIGTYRDEYAVAVGVYHYVRDNVMFNLGASICSDGDLMGRAGISFAVGKKDKDKPALAQNMNDVQKQLMEVQYALQELKDENAALKKQLRKQ